MTQQQPDTKDLSQTKFDDYGGIETGTSRFGNERGTPRIVEWGRGQYR